MADDSGNREEKGSPKEACWYCPVVSLLGAGGVLREKVMDAFPADFVEHAVGVRREFLLAIRSLVDQALKAQDSYLEDYRRRQVGREAKKRGPQKVAVE